MKSGIVLSLLAVLCAATTFARETVRWNQLSVRAAEGWNLRQEALSDGTVVLGFSKGKAYATLYSRAEKLNSLKDILSSVSIMDAEHTETYGEVAWRVLEIEKSKTSYARLFATEHRGQTYFGYVSHDTQEGLEELTREFLFNIVSSHRSLTDQNYFGKKYYLGWGAAMSGDPSSMHNEVKYDVKHTNDVFTQAVGGNYIGTSIVGSSVANPTSVRTAWKELGGKIQKDDMYVQYSSGHGSRSGLFPSSSGGLPYTEIRDSALSYPAREIVIFTMSCHSGGLVNAFNSKKSEWENWSAQGRTLFVMSSSTVDQTSSTGPGKDALEPNGPYGSAGSAYGHALWKALIGQADGFADGVKDNFLTLKEIADFTKDKTKKLGGHTPVVTGSYNPGLIMARVPTAAFVAALEAEGGTASLSDDEIMERIRDLDKELAL